MKKFLTSLFALVVVMFSVGALAARQPVKTAPPSTERRQFSQELTLSHGIVASITVIAQEDRESSVMASMGRAMETIAHLDAALGNGSGNIRDQINHLSPGTSLELPNDIFSLFEQAQNLAVVTEGWFDITAPSPKGWFIKRDYRRVKLDPEAKTIAVKSRDMQFDTSWLLQGAAVDTALHSLIRDGITDARVEVGGTARNIGRDLFTPWSLTLGLIPKGSASLAHRAFHYNLPNIAVAVITPATAVTLVDARSKRPVTPHVQSVTIFAQDAVTAVAFAVAVYSLEPLTGIRYVERFPAIKGMIVDEQGNLFASSGLASANQPPSLAPLPPPISTEREQGPNDLRQKQREEESE